MLGVFLKIFFLFFFYFSFYFLFIYGCVGSSLLCEGSLQLRQAGATPHRGARASPVAEHRLQMRRLSNCGSRAQPPRGMRDPSRPGLEPVSPAPAGRLSTTAPPGKPCLVFYNHFFIKGNCFPSHSMQNVVQLHMNKPLINTSFGIYFLTALL